MNDTPDISDAQEQEDGATPPPRAMPIDPEVGAYYSNLQNTGVSAQKTDGFAITSLVFGLIPCGLISGLCAVIFGVKAQRRIKKSNGATKGEGLARAGIILGSIQLVAIFIFLIVDMIDLLNTGL
ncbi:MAG TPA: DUF4190 domain-containing protein [Acidimicrobiia bacterium]|nr:DUF4190 domain-containing protein [Acidimicrobiia bacterium]